MKRCPRCDEEKALAEFNKDRRSSDGLKQYCRPCSRAYCRAAPSQSGVGGREKNLAYRESPEGRAVALVARARRRSETKGRECTVTSEWVLSRIREGRCMVTGIPFDLRLTTESNSNPLAPSLDRIDSDLGYTEENCQVVLSIFNFCKNDYPQAVVEDLICRMAEGLVE